METNPITVKRKVLEDDLRDNERTILTYRIAYPYFEADKYQLSLSALNRFYADAAHAYEKYVRDTLYPRALEQLADAPEGEAALPYEATEEYTVTYDVPCVLSLYTDRYEFTGGAHGSTTRQAQTWNLPKFYRIPLSELYGCGTDYKDFFIREARAQADTDPGKYLENYPKLLADTFDERQFYCTPRGIVLFYQQYAVAPYSSGICEFMIPYSTCVRDPVSTCYMR